MNDVSKPAQNREGGDLQGSEPLSARQIKILEWVDEHNIYSSEWRRGKRIAYGPPETWTAIRFTGDGGATLTIASSDHEAVRDLIGVGPLAWRGGSLFVLSDDGKAALSKARGETK